MLDYTDILEEQKIKLRKDLRWWPNFLYHFTDVHNASSILNKGWIYSREQAENQNIMFNDNASTAVIKATNFESKSYGRLYFRPLTPTQYHNEGYKPEAIRDAGINASCPVPIFLCLSANGILKLEDTKFAERGISGSRDNIKEGIEEFKKLDFDKIYHEGYYEQEQRDIKEYRHSEVISKNGFPVEPFLKCILCRSQAERETLLYLLKQCSVGLYNTYRDKVLYKPTLKCFYENGIFLKHVTVENGCLNLHFNDPERRKPSRKESLSIKLHVELIYRKSNGSVVGVETAIAIIDYDKIRSIEVILKDDKNYDTVGITINLDDAVMYENEIVINNDLF